MQQSGLKTAHALSGVIVALMLAASAGGLLIDGLYRDNLLVTSGWLGNDLVTLVLAVPLMAAALLFAKRGSMRAQLVWLGMLAYVLYNYAFYLFAAAFNAFFLVYTVLFTLSIFALIFSLKTIDGKAIAGRFRPRTPVKWVAGYMLLVVLLLGGFHIALSLSYLFTGQVPEIIVAVEHPTNIISALDLSMVVPPGMLGAIWLWRSQPWGYVLGVIWNVKGAVYMVALSAATLSAYRAGATDDLTQLVLWGFICVGSLISSILLLGNIKSSPE